MLSKFAIVALLGVAQASYMNFRETAEDFDADVDNFENDINSDVFGKPMGLDSFGDDNWEASSSFGDFEAGGDDSMFGSRFKSRSMGPRGPTRRSGPSRTSGSSSMRERIFARRPQGPQRGGSRQSQEERDEGKETWYSNEQEFSDNRYRYYSDATKHVFAMCELRANFDNTESGKIRLQ